MRFETPLYTVAEAARIVDVPTATLRNWAKGSTRRPKSGPDITSAPVITLASPSRHLEPSIPFIGLAEALVLAAVCESGVPMQRTRPALAQLEKEIGIAHGLASRKLYTDGAELLFDYGERHPDTAEGRRSARGRPACRIP